MIRLLPESVSSHLRSGVSVTSVAQCVEELVLNSLDAGALCVAVRLDLPCFKVQVVDNGSGIPFSQLDDVATRHFTSKCNELADLENLKYFGFRGEALASICDISAILEVVTRVKQSTKTYSKFFHNGKGRPASEARLQRPAAGTTITVHDLFNKLPVRKTMTNPTLELERVRQRLEGIALMNPQVSISFRNDENANKILQTNKASSCVGIFKQLFGAAKANTLTEVCCTKDKFKVLGYIGTEGHFNKNLQFVYINSRLVLKTKIHKLLNKALKKTYSNRKKIHRDAQSSAAGSPSSSSPTKQTERHGVFIVKISCPFNEYDITFDPAKTLVEFKDWETVISSVEGIIDEFQKLLSVSVSPVSTEDKVSDKCTNEIGDRTEACETETAPAEISTMLTTNSLHSEVVKRSMLENTSTREDKGQVDSPAQDTSNEFNNSKQPGKTVSGDLHRSCDSEVSLLSSDTPSTSGSLCVDGEDPLYSPAVCDVHPGPATSSDHAVEANDSGIDPGAIADENPATINAVTSFSSLFKQPKTSGLSHLRHKQTGRTQGSKTVSIKLQELRQSLFNQGSIRNQSECQTNSGISSQTKSISQSLQRLRETVSLLKSNERDDASDAGQHGTDLEQRTSVEEEPGQPKQTTSSKLAKLAGFKSSVSTAHHQSNVKTSDSAINKDCCDISHGHKIRKGKESESSLYKERIDVPRSLMMTDCVSNVHQTTPGSSLDKNTETSSQTISSKQRPKQFLTSESLITTISDIPQSKKACEVTSDCTTVHNIENYANITSKAGTLDFGDRTTQKPLHIEGIPLSPSADANIDQCALSTPVLSKSNILVDKDRFQTCTSADITTDNTVNIFPQKPTKNPENKQKVTQPECKNLAVFSSQDSEIHVNQGIQNLVEADDVFKSYKIDEIPENTPLTAAFIPKVPLSSGDNSSVASSNTEDCPLPADQLDVKNRVSQGFDLRTSQLINDNTSQTVMTDFSKSSDTAVSSISCTDECDVNAIPSDDSFNNTNQVNCDANNDFVSPRKDLVDLLITPSPVTDQVESDNTAPCPNQPGFFTYSIGNQSSSDDPTADMRYARENALSSSPVNTEVHKDDVCYDNLFDTYIQTDVPPNVAMAKAKRDENGKVEGISETEQISAGRERNSELSTNSQDMCIQPGQKPNSDSGNTDREMTESSGETGSSQLNRDKSSETLSSCPETFKEIINNPTSDPGKTEDLEMSQGNNESLKIKAKDQSTTEKDQGTGQYLTRCHPLSGKRIFINPHTGHTIGETDWEKWQTQNNCSACDGREHVPNKKRRLLPHDLASVLCKPSSSTDKLKGTGDTVQKSGLDDLWSEHMIDQAEDDGIKWRHPQSRDGSGVTAQTSDSLADLFENWENPVFALPEQDITSVELPNRHTRAAKVQKALQPYRFTKNMLTNVQILGQVDDKFIACLMRTNDKNLSAENNVVVLVDQHAAHERVRLEQLTQDSFVSDQKRDVKFLKRSEVIPPAKLKLTEDVVRVMTAYQDKFEKMGLEFSTTDRRDSVLIKCAPLCFIEKEASEIKRGKSSVVMEIIESFINEQVELLKTTHGAMSTVPPAVHKLLCSQACHGAIKFGDSLSLQECEELLKSLSLCDLPFQCAHGRPSVMPILDLHNFRTKFPMQSLGKPKLWKLRQKVEESMLEETMDQEKSQ